MRAFAFLLLLAVAGLASSRPCVVAASSDPAPLEWALNPQSPCAADSVVLVFHGRFPIWDQGAIYDPYYMANRDSFARVARAGVDRVVVRTVYRPDRPGSSESGSFGVPVGLGRLEAGSRHFTIEHHRLVQLLSASLDSTVVETPLDVEVTAGCVAPTRPIEDLPWIDQVAWEPFEGCAWKPMTLVVRGSFNNGCPRVLLAAADDSAHARMVIRMKASVRNVGCTDDVPHWTQRIAMGLPGPGVHHLELGYVQLGYNYQWPPAPQERYTGVLDVPAASTCGGLPPRLPLPGVTGVGAFDAGACEAATPGSGIPVAIRGEFPDGCHRVQGIALLPNPLGLAPPLVRVAVTRDDGSCLAQVTPWCVETRIPSLPAGQHALMVQVTETASGEGETGDPPMDAFVLVVPRTLSATGGGEGTVGVGASETSARWALSAPWPNPASASVWVRLSVPHEAPVRVTVHDLAGRLVQVLHQGTLPLGEHVLRWDGRDRDGVQAHGGVYFLRVTAEGESAARRLVVFGDPR